MSNRGLFKNEQLITNTLNSCVTVLLICVLWLRNALLQYTLMLVYKLKSTQKCQSGFDYITVPAILPISSLLTFKIPLVLGMTGHLKLKEKHLSPHPRLTT